MFVFGRVKDHRHAVQPGDGRDIGLDVQAGAHRDGIAVPGACLPSVGDSDSVSPLAPAFDLLDLCQEANMWPEPEPVTVALQVLNVLHCRQVVDGFVVPAVVGEGGQLGGRDELCLI